MLYRLGARCALGNAIRYIRAVRECELRTASQKLAAQSEIRPQVDKTKRTPGGCFAGVDAIARVACA